MEFIEKEKISSYIRENFSIDKTKNADICFAFIDFMNWLDEAPTADVVEVVRCKDCRYCDLEGRCEAPENGLTREYVKPDDFCSYGERRKENGR